ncbi:MAG: ankyrin repeat domain-containing protein [Gammaproteobacteria bacterium]|nr:ankyrin repeat domain-containing protein [Gammaproteobacteria bacterium]
MHTRHPLEEALALAIIQGSKSYEKIIELIDQSSVASLESQDAEGKSFLFLALEHNRKVIIDVLFASQKENEIVLLAKDNKGLSLLHRTILNRDLEMFKKLFLAIEAVEKLLIVKNKKPALYLEADNQRNNLLHYSVINKVQNALVFLLENRDCLQIINDVNSEGDTPLHLAFKHEAYKFIPYLINAGSDLFLINHDKKLPLILLAMLSLEKQKEILSLLDKEKQKIVLHAYRQLLMNETLVEKYKTKHTKFFEQHSIKKYLYSHYEFNDLLDEYRKRLHHDEIPNLKENYLQLSACYDLQTGLYAQHEFNERMQDTRDIDRNILLHMPLYVLRLLPVEMEEVNTSLLIEDENGLKNLSEAQRLSKDTLTLVSFIHDLEVFLNDLQNRRQVSDKQRVLTATILAFSITTWIAVYIWYFQTDMETMDLSENLAALMTPILLCATSIFIAFLIQRKSYFISYGEWKWLIDRLQKDVLEPMQYLENQEKIDNKKYLPTSVDNIRTLENDMNELTKGIDMPILGKSCNDYSIVDMSLIILRLTDILKTIRDEMNLLKKPLSLGIFKPVPMEDSSSSSSDELEAGLLSNYKSLVRYDSEEDMPEIVVRQCPT